MASGHSCRARTEGMAECTPKARASYVQEATTPRAPAPPTITGLPASEGSSSTSTDAKNASMSTWRTVGTSGRAGPSGTEVQPAEPFGVPDACPPALLYGPTPHGLAGPPLALPGELCAVAVDR